MADALADDRALGADDIYLPEKLERQVAVLPRRPFLEWLRGYLREIGSRGRSQR